MSPVRKGNRPSEDPRVRRSVRALGHALVELLHERDFDAITVQDVLDRAGVGRTTFYSHYRNKEDVLFSGFESVIGMFAAQLDRPSTLPRLLPVTEFLGHIAEVDQFLGALRRSGKLEGMMSLMTDHMARLIDQRIVAVPGAPPAVPRQLLARMLAAAFVEMLRWWTEQTARAAPAQMDATFHALASVAMQRERYVIRGANPSRLGP